VGTNTGIEVFTSRPDTLPGAAFLVLAPEHPLLDSLKDKIANWSEVETYQEQARLGTPSKAGGIQKSGILLEGLIATHPLIGHDLPLWVADYVLLSYGTGAIMAVPGGDERDLQFAQQHNLPVPPDIGGGDVEAMINRLERLGSGEGAVNYHLRDWVFSRQRYWGEPIPLVNCTKCGWVPVPEDQLPLLLPEVETYEPSGTGDSPLATLTDWVSTQCPRCGGPGQRETDTMPNWAGSSWYFLRYTDPTNPHMLAGRDKLNYWLPVDWYNGGMEHTTLHLLYSRFWHRFLFDIGVVPCPEPYKRRTSHGMILATNNEKMSKSRGNVINPDDVVAEYGADTFRLYELFIGAFDQATPWSDQSIRGCRRFLEKVWQLKDFVKPGNIYSDELEGDIHRTIKKVSQDCEVARFNTAVSALMTLVNKYNNQGKVTKAEYRALLLLLNPFAPHITEELWELVGYKGRLHQESWPVWDEAKALRDTIKMAVQINGKTRAIIRIRAEAEEEEVKSDARNAVSDYLDGKIITREIFVPGRVWNIVTE
jgi:leucyl-tRNA synthetase